MGKIASTRFSARVFLTAEDVDSIKVWVDELYPVEPMKRASEEWVEEFLGERTREEFIDYVNCQDALPSPLLGEGCYQLIIHGELEGYKSSTQDGTEYDEDIQIDKVAFVKLPDDWYDQLDVVDQDGGELGRDLTDVQ